MEEQLHKKIDDMVKSEKVFIFMKGTPEMPECGFSMRMVQLLRALGTKFGSFNVFDDDSVRQGIKEYANWPTIPQLYIDGEFIGGSDIAQQMFDSGELKKMLD
jgi:monothiol glutaredoxin